MAGRPACAGRGFGVGGHGRAAIREGLPRTAAVLALCYGCDGTFGPQAI